MPRSPATSESAPPNGRLPRWHVLYFLLAAFDLLTVLFSVYVNYRIMSIYTASVEVNHEWIERQSRYSRLRTLAGDAKAPGNDVFESHAVETEAGRLERAVSVFIAELAQARADLRLNVRDEEAQPVLRDLEELETAFAGMTAEAQLILERFRAGDAQAAAGRHRAAMDRRYAQVRAAFGTLELHVREIAQGHLDRQSAQARSLERAQYLIAAFVIVMLMGASPSTSPSP